MSTTNAISVAAGWYADPVEIRSTGVATQRRWWDGAVWTHHTAPLQTPVSPDLSPETVAIAAASAAAAVAAPTSVFAVVTPAPATLSPRESARAAENMPLHPVEPSAGLRGSSATLSPSAPSALSPANADTAAYEPFRHRTRVEVERIALASSTARNPLGLRVHTVSVWLIATMPITQALLMFWVFSTLPAESSAWTRALAVAFPFLLTAALAGQDTRLMELSGHLRTAPWITALLAPPVYLALRGVRVARETGASPWPLVVWAVTQLAIIAIWAAVDPAGAQSLLRIVF